MNLWPFNRTEAAPAMAAARVEPAVPAPAPAAPQNADMPSSSGVYGSELYRLLADGQSAAGVAVTEQSAMRVSAVYACVGLLGGAMSCMPCHIYRRDGAERERADHPVWWLLNEQPWAALSAAVFWEYAMWSLMLHGDWFARIHRASAYSPDIKGFEPLHPQTVQVQRNGDRLAYVVYRDGRVAETIDQDDMLHVPGVGFNGLRGMSPLRFALRGPAGISLAADEFSGAYFRHGAKAEHAIVVPGKADADQVRLMQDKWVENRHLGNAFVPPVLSGGAKLEPITMSAADAQLLETRRMQVEEIARIYGIPPFMIGHASTTTTLGSSIEQMGISFVKYTLGRHLVKFEQEINRKCFRTIRYFAEFATAGLERGDMKARYEAYRIALGRAGEMPWIDTDTICRLENLPKPKAAAAPAASKTGE